MLHSLLLLALAADAAPPLIPREVLFAREERLAPKLSPDGKRLGWLGRDRKNPSLLQVWVRSLDAPAEVELAADRSRGYERFEFTADSEGVLATQSVDSDGNTKVVLLDLSTQTARELTPKSGVRAQLLSPTSRLPDTVLVTTNQRDRKSSDVWRVNLKTGAADLDTVNPGDVQTWVIDPAFIVRGAVALTAEGGTEVRIRESAKAPWKAFITAGLEESLGVFGFTADNRGLLLSTTISGDTARVIEKNLKSGTERVLAQNEKSDPLAVLHSPTRHVLQAVSFTDAGHEDWRSLDYTVTADLEALKKLGPSEPTVVSTDAAEQKWVVAFNQDTAPTRYAVLDRKAKTSTPVLASTAKDPGYAPMTPVSFAARDGVPLTGFLTAPVSAEGKKWPLVVLVHEGPWSFDRWRFHTQVQLFANRGYAVLQVNFRGSTGSGKRFAQAGHRQWGGAMTDDVLDGVRWAIEQFPLDAKRVAIVGQGYGGFAALTALQSAPELFACGVDVFGPLVMSTRLAVSDPVSKPTLLRRIGNPAEPADKEVLARAAPIAGAEKIRSPLLIIAGEIDPKVKSGEIDQLLAGLSPSVPVTVVTYLNERDALTRFENELDLQARIELFLASCLGGRAEPLPREGRVPGSTGVFKTSGPRK